MIFLLLVVILTFTCAQHPGMGGRWTEKAIDTTLMARRCFHPLLVPLYEELLAPLRDIPLRRQLDADALVFLAQDLGTTREFCDALVRVARQVRDRLRHSVRAERGAYRLVPMDMAANGWQTTLDQLDAIVSGNDFRARCLRRRATIERNHTLYDTGPLSRTRQCLMKHRKEGQNDHFRSRFKHEENRAKGL